MLRDNLVGLIEPMLRAESETWQDATHPAKQHRVEGIQISVAEYGGQQLRLLNQDGRDLLRGNRHWFEDAVAEAGIRDFTWHDLRHTFASRLIMAGVGIRNVQDLMGHKTINMTAPYAHLEPAQQLEAHLLGFGSKSRMRIVRKKAKARATDKRAGQAAS